MTLQPDDCSRATTAEFSDNVPGLPDAGVWEHRLPEDHVLVSDGICKLVGIAPSRVTANLDFWNDRVHAEDRPRYEAAYNGFLSGKTPSYETVYRVQHVDGRWISVLARARWDQREGERRLARGYVMDVTWSERIKLQAEVIERMSEGVLLMARDGLIHFANTAVELTLGYKPGELTGLNANQLSYRTQQEFDAQLQMAFDATENGASALLDMETRRRDGMLLPLQGRFSSLLLSGRRYVVAVFTDVSTRRQLEREMLQIATDVQHRVGGDLHEGLGQELSGIAMMLQALAARTSTGAPPQRKEFDDVVAQLNAAVGRTRQLARGLSPVRASTRGLREGLEELVNELHEVHGQRATLHFELPAEFPLDEHCANALFHIAQEALDNAARHAGARDIEIGFAVNGSDLELQVTDNGIGFDPARTSYLGMGLRMMRFRAEMARGSLSIESQPGQGARLRCRCPTRTDHIA